MKQKTIIVIPARLGSTRISEKILINLGGISMVQRVYLICCKSKYADKVVVATDSQKVVDNITEIGGQAILTQKDHACGTDRTAEIAQRFPEYEYLIDVHADLPLLRTEVVDELIKAFKASDADAITPCTPITSHHQINNPAIVKVVMDQNQNALYFSRSPIPYNRDNKPDVAYYRHIGIFGYRRNLLLKFSSLPSTLEHIEKIEPLRLLENGYKLNLIQTDYNETSVNTPEELDTIKQYFLTTSQN